MHTFMLVSQETWREVKLGGVGKVGRCAGREGLWGGDIWTELAGVKEDV